MQQLFHTGIEAGGNFYVRQVVGQGRALDHPYIYAAALDGRFTALNSFGVGGDQRDNRALMAVMIKQDPGTDQRGHNGEDPHR